MKTAVPFIIVLAALSGLWATADETAFKIARGSVYGAINYYSLQADDSMARISDPGIFEGDHRMEFDRSGGFGFSLGMNAERTAFFTGGEFEFIMSSSDLIHDFPAGTIYEGLNSLDQLSLNLNVHLGKEFGNRLFRPYVFGGIGYTEVKLVGHYGLATINYEDQYDSTFGYHAGIGADLRIVKGLYLQAGYRYYETTDARLEARGRSIEFSNSGQMAHLGIKYIYFPLPDSRTIQ